jgi:DNA mismatch repair protein MutL
MLRAIPQDDVKRLCAGQVIVDLCSIVKELVENALDAGATTVEIRLTQHGAKGVEVSDNGVGVRQADHGSLARKHHTSKLRAFGDLDSIQSFGFRGEALASLASVAQLSIITRTASDPTGFLLQFDHCGELSSSKGCARECGTTVSVTDVFCNLPVRQAQYIKHIAREYAKLVPLVQSYALVCTGVRIALFNTPVSGKRQIVFSSAGAPCMLENVHSIFAQKEAQSLESLSTPTIDIADGNVVVARVHVEGVVTSLQSHGGAPLMFRNWNGLPPIVFVLLHIIRANFHSLPSTLHSRVIKWTSMLPQTSALSSLRIKTGFSRLYENCFTPIIWAATVYLTQSPRTRHNQN